MKEEDCNETVIHETIISKEDFLNFFNKCQ